MGDDWKGEFDFFKRLLRSNLPSKYRGDSTTKIKNDLFAVSNG